ncbi:MAG: flavodoxin-dependent (E)-4-hydroxy-3-methylbut-2-enyl-diphosphate synthase [Acidobacteria bacterium]|nr:flavodoxin-dependent (E)-4-hydroxy-3-methylbut-2-enyl-diphosphate synthase [Acidobacteriota bacterium]
MSAIHRRKTRTVAVGSLTIGDPAPVTVQSMTNTDTRDVTATLSQIRRLEGVGCEIIRLAVPDQAAADALPAIRAEVKTPLVADIHFDYRLALAALDAGVDKLRLNPGNIGDPPRVRQVVSEAKRRRIPIRIGVNAGSLARPLLRKYGHPCAEALVESALQHVAILEDLNFRDIVISLKASNVAMCVAAYRLMARQTDYPLHLGITEAGTFLTGTIASAAGIGALLLDGIGDTIRVSLTAPPEEEVRVGFRLLRVLDVRRHGPRFISCPSCGRTTVDLVGLANAIEERLAWVTQPVTIAVMGCEVNGPGEAAEADIGLACGRKASLIFQKGAVVKKITNDHLVEEFVREVAVFLHKREESSSCGE